MVTAHADGSWRGEIAYTPFGETRSSQGTTSTDYRFTGQRLEAELGLYFYQARWYDPALGVFAQADTVIPDPGNPLDMNRYSYVRFNPLKYTDPSGHSCYSVGGRQMCAPEPIDNDYRMLILGRYYHEDIVRYVDKGFDNSQAEMIYRSLGLLENSFGGNLAALKAGVGVMRFVKWGRDAGMAPPLSNKIYLGNERFEGSENTVLHKILHEVAHRFDFEGAWGFPKLYKSDTFIMNFNENASCTRGYLGCLGNDPGLLYIAVNNFSGIGQYDPIGKTTRYAKRMGSIEDFADSFASAVLIDNGYTAPTGEVVSPNRMMLISALIMHQVERVNHLYDKR